MNFYNEIDPAAAAWTRELIRRGLIPDGVVDERSISEIEPHELTGYTQCHFFSGISLWPLALRIAGWPDDRPVWTGSCPCQPFSSAGKGLATEDERHLWPVFHKLIEACRPPIVFGEQVASAAVVGSASGKAQRSPNEPPVWLDGVFADLEGASYACAAADIPAAGVGAPHIRQRLYWGAADRLADGVGQQPHWAGESRNGRGQLADDSRLGHAHHARPQGHDGHVGEGDQPGRIGAEPTGSVGPTSEVGERLGDASGGGLGEFGDETRTRSGGHSDGAVESCGSADTDKLNGDGAGYGASDDRRELGGETELQGFDDLRGMDDTSSSRCNGSLENSEGNSRDETRLRLLSEGCGYVGVGHPDKLAERQQCGWQQRQQPQDNRLGEWGDFRLVFCRDNKHRRVPVESRFFPLVDCRQYLVPGLARRGSVRPALLKGSGNAIVPEVAVAFIKAFTSALNDA